MKAASSDRVGFLGQISCQWLSVALRYHQHNPQGLCCHFPSTLLDFALFSTQQNQVFVMITQIPYCRTTYDYTSEMQRLQRDTSGRANQIIIKKTLLRKPLFEYFWSAFCKRVVCSSAESIADTGTRSRGCSRRKDTSSVLLWTRYGMFVCRRHATQD